MSPQKGSDLSLDFKLQNKWNQVKYLLECWYYTDERLWMCSRRLIVLKANVSEWCWPFFGAQWPINCNLVEDQRTIIRNYYSYMLEHNVESAVRSKCRGILTRRVILQHVSTRLHTAQLTWGKPQYQTWEVIIAHPTYRSESTQSSWLTERFLCQLN